MEVTKSQKRLLIILGIVVAYAAYDFISNKDDYDKMYGGKKEVVVKTNPSDKLQLTAVKQKQISDLDMHFKRDPFFRDDMVKEIKKFRKKIKPRQRPLKLQAITYSGDNSFVMINDLILKEGEMVEGYLVEQIEKTRVRLTKKGKSIYLNSK